MNILLVYGGNSCEHDISVITACLAKGYFDGNLYSAYFTQDNRCFLVDNALTPAQHKKGKFRNSLVFLTGTGKIGILHGRRIFKTISVDVVVNCCHGRCGEDGTLAALCKLCNLPLVGSDIVASAIAMDKVLCKRVLQSMNFPVVEGVELTNDNVSLARCQQQLGFPVIVKPATLGSSIGVSICRDSRKLSDACRIAFSYDTSVLCERALENFYELNCSAMREKGEVLTSDVDRPFTNNDILTFHDKYQRGEKFLCPSQEVEESLSSRVKEMTAQIYDRLHFSGVIRVDYLVCDGTLYVNEINSVPGSLAYGLWQTKYTPKQFGSALLRQAIDSYKANESLQTSFVSSVLQGNITKK